MVTKINGIHTWIFNFLADFGPMHLSGTPPMLPSYPLHFPRLLMQDAVYAFVMVDWKISPACCMEIFAACIDMLMALMWLDACFIMSCRPKSKFSEWLRRDKLTVCAQLICFISDVTWFATVSKPSFITFIVVICIVWIIVWGKQISCLSIQRNWTSIHW